MADGEAAIYLGYGRTKAGVVGNNAGFNANTLISNNSKVSDWIYTDGKISKATGKYKIQQLRNIIQSITTGITIYN